MEEEKPILYKEDILKELAEETGKDYELLDEMVSLNIKYLKETVITTDVMSIRLPGIGILSPNYELILGSTWLNYRKRLRSRRNESVKRRWQMMKEHLDEHYLVKEIMYNTPTVHFYYSLIHNKRFNNITKYLYDAWAKVAEFHNEYYQKHLK